ncbi:hypothetical protein M3N64_07550 [Sporolactobacillus sp. CPB3-1]|uniref:Polyhydroxyalkanoate synthesis regulator n=1 Tax=Sporolactobacillus mangiferae TaxID=2940498 RepID=A0ABT0MAB4_9BACL|nr:hypothetical protein [Sporolactobacillus mangiferae]MCL1631803.1 hypothetical protein [Sporolactobacillus mangiferae]
MNDFLRKSLLIGIGVTIVGKEKAEKVLNDLSKSGSAASEEVQEYLGLLSDKGKENTNKLRQEAIEALKDFGFVTRDEYAALKDKLSQLETEIAELKQVSHDPHKN